MNNPVIIVTPTIMDGTVARWYRTVEDAVYKRPVLTASRRGVSVPAEFLTDLPEEWVTAAKDAYERLLRNRDADLTELATHQHDRFANGPIVPIVKEG